MLTSTKHSWDLKCIQLNRSCWPGGVPTGAHWWASTWRHGLSNGKIDSHKRTLDASEAWNALPDPEGHRSGLHIQRLLQQQCRHFINQKLRWKLLRLPVYSKKNMFGSSSVWTVRFTGCSSMWTAEEAKHHTLASEGYVTPVTCFERPSAHTAHIMSTI